MCVWGWGRGGGGREIKEGSLYLADNMAAAGFRGAYGLASFLEPTSHMVRNATTHKSLQPIQFHHATDPMLLVSICETKAVCD